MGKKLTFKEREFARPHWELRFLIMRFSTSSSQQIRCAQQQIAWLRMKSIPGLAALPFGMACTLSVKCVSLWINPLLTYQFVSHWIVSVMRYQKPKLHWVLRPDAETSSKWETVINDGILLVSMRTLDQWTWRLPTYLTTNPSEGYLWTDQILSKKLLYNFSLSSPI